MYIRRKEGRGWEQPGANSLESLLTGVLSRCTLHTAHCTLQSNYCTEYCTLQKNGGSPHLFAPLIKRNKQNLKKKVFLGHRTAHCTLYCNSNWMLHFTLSTLMWWQSSFKFFSSKSQAEAPVPVGGNNFPHCEHLPTSASDKKNRWKQIKTHNIARIANAVQCHS